MSRGIIKSTNKVINLIKIQTFKNYNYGKRNQI